MILKIIALVAVILAVVVLFIPNKYINTASCKRNWVVVLTILTGISFVSDQNSLGFGFLTILSLGIFINYALPFLLNVLESFNWKSDP